MQIKVQGTPKDSDNLEVDLEKEAESWNQMRENIRRHLNNDLMSDTNMDAGQQYEEMVQKLEHDVRDKISVSSCWAYLYVFQMNLKMQIYNDFMENKVLNLEVKMNKKLDESIQSIELAD